MAPCIWIESALALCDRESSCSIIRERFPDKPNEVRLTPSVDLRILLELDLPFIELFVESIDHFKLGLLHLLCERCIICSLRY